MMATFKKGDVVRRKGLIPESGIVSTMIVKGVILAHPGSRQVSCILDEDGVEIEIACGLLEKIDV